MHLFDLDQSVYINTKVKLTEFGQPKTARIRPVESLIKNHEAIKSYKSD